MTQPAEERATVLPFAPEPAMPETPSQETDAMTDAAADQVDKADQAERTGPLAGAADWSPDDWPRDARRTWKVAKLLAAGLLVVWLIGWPLGNTIGATTQAGRLTIVFGYTLSVLLLAPMTAALTLGVGYALAAGLRLEDSAKRLSEAALGFAGGLGPRGHAARSEIDALNTEIDRALGRLAEAESLIRRQVDAINTAGEAATANLSQGSERLDAERRALIAVTEEMSREAEAVAGAIADRTKAAAETGADVQGKIAQSETQLDGQIHRLEEVSARSLERFETLATAMEGRSDALATQAEVQSEATAKLGENQSALEKAQAELAEQSTRLEALIRDQRKRADKLARAVSDQTSKLTRLGQKKSPAPGRRGAWRDILATVERSLPGAGADPSEDDVKQAMDRLVTRMQRFSLTLRTQLYGGPPAGDLARFEQGERLVFVKQLLDEDQTSFRDRVATEAARNAVFDQAVREFLGDFDALMEPVTSAPDADAAMAEYLRSPLGRLYVAIGTALGRFDAKK